MSLHFRLLLALALLGMCLGASVLQTRAVSDADQQIILDAHNAFRRGVSPTATDMRKMYWDADLARSAQAWADQCSSTAHDDNYARRQSANIGAPVGQNYAQDYSWAASIAAWHSEVQYFHYATQASTTDGQAVGHYTQVVWGQSSLVGCGFANCGTEQRYICNYAYGNLAGTKVYTSGTSCAACTGKCDDKLCDCPSGKICKNGGSINLNNCSCTCANGFTGDSCEICPWDDVSKACGTFYMPDKCAEWSNVPANCPVMCGFCPDACPGKDINSCQNNGKLQKDCSCLCASGYTGLLCETVSNCSDPAYCGKEQPYGYPQSFCDLYTNVPEECPKMCGKC